MDAWLAELGGWRAETIDRLRRLIERAVPDVAAEIKWQKPSNRMSGHPVFSRDGLICTTEPYKDKVKVTFARGASLDDPATLFNAGFGGTTRRAIDLFERARSLDPLNFPVYSFLARAYAYAGRWDDAERVLDELVGLSPLHRSHFDRGLVHLGRGRTVEALQEFSAATRPSRRLVGQVVAYAELGRSEASDQALRELRELGEGWDYQRAQAHAGRGETDAAFQWLDAALENRDPGILFLRCDPFLRGLHEDPRWSQLLARVGPG